MGSSVRSTIQSVVRSLTVGGGGGALTAYQVLNAASVAHYNGLGDSPNDVSGNARHGTWTGTPAYTTAPTGITGRAFTTSSGNYISLPSPLDGSSAWTAAAWIRATSLANNCSPFVGSLSVNAHPTVRWTSADSKLHFYASLANDFHVNNITGSTVISTATWYHVAVQYNGTTAKIWINGIDVSVGGTVTAGKTLTTDTTRIGGGVNASAAAWVGAVADVFLFNSALTGSQIATLIAGG